MLCYLKLKGSPRKCHVSLFEKCSQYHGYKENTRVISRTYRAIGQMDQMNLVCTRALSVGNAYYLQRLQIMKVKSRARGSLLHPISRMLKNISIEGTS